MYVYINDIFVMVSLISFCISHVFIVLMLPVLYMPPNQITRLHSKASCRFSGISYGPTIITCSGIHAICVALSQCYTYESAISK